MKKKNITLGTLSLILLFGITACTSSNTKTTTSTTEATTMVTTEATTELAEEIPDNLLGFDLTFYDSYPNDTSEKWRLAVIAEDIDIQTYALEYYKNYFKSDDEIHIIINEKLNTTTKILIWQNMLDVTITKYVDKEEQDATIAGSGELIAEYHVNIGTGEITKIRPADSEQETTQEEVPQFSKEVTK